MAWSKTTEKGRLIAKETLTFGEGTADIPSSIIDFIPKGADFTLIANTGATNLSAGVSVDIHAAALTTDTFTQLKADLIADIDNAVKAAFYDNSANGDSPYFKVVLDPAGAMKYGDTVGLVVIV